MKTYLSSIILILLSLNLSGQHSDTIRNETSIKVIKYFNSGKVSEVIYYDLFYKRKGLNEKYYRNGQLKLSSYWSENRLINIVSQFSKNGRLLYSGDFVNGHGKLFFYNDKGKIFRIEEYINYKTYNTYEITNNPLKTSCFEGKIQSKKVFHKSVLIMEEIYLSDTTYQYHLYNKKGVILSSIFYIDNNKSKWIDYSKGIKNRIIKLYDTKGNITKTDIYIGGVLVD